MTRELLKGRYLRVIEEAPGGIYGWLLNDFNSLPQAKKAALTYYKNANACGDQVKPVYVVDKEEKSAWRLLGGAWVAWELPLRRNT